MRSTVNIASPVVRPRFTTIARVKDELKISDESSDAILGTKIDEASADIELALGFTVSSESVIETFRHGSTGAVSAGYYNASETDADVIFLRRKAVSTITSVTLDDTVLDPTEYFLDKDTGTLNRLDKSGYPSPWCFCKSLIIAYTAGYVLPGKDGANLLPSIEGVTVDLLKMFWFNRTRDPLIKSENIPGVGQTDYWVGSVGDPNLLPPDVQRKVSLIRRPGVAVA